MSEIKRNEWTSYPSCCSRHNQHCESEELHLDEERREFKTLDYCGKLFDIIDTPGSFYSPWEGNQSYLSLPLCPSSSHNELWYSQGEQSGQTWLHLHVTICTTCVLSRLVSNVDISDVWWSQKWVSAWIPETVRRLSYHSRSFPPPLQRGQVRKDAYRNRYYCTCNIFKPAI